VITPSTPASGAALIVTVAIDWSPEQGAIAASV
jgi:hypothetical protein